MNGFVLCEKASQARDLEKALGNRYGPILPARGHILTLAEPQDIRDDWKDWSPGLLWPGRFYPKTPVRGTERLLEAIRKAARGANQAIIATDCDREGQLIGDEILEFIRFDGRVLRALFTAQDPKSLQAAFAKLDDNAKWRGRYMAGQAREQADQVTNLSLTRTATCVLRAHGSRDVIGIGRVKTPVLGIVCRREKEIENFRPEEYFEVHAHVTVARGSLVLACKRMPETDERTDAEDDGIEDGDEALASKDGIEGRICDRSEAQALAAAVTGHNGPLSVRFAKRRRAPPKLMDLSAMQAACSARFGWTGQKTLDVAQSLYASPFHVLTYPRGEARHLPETEIENVPALLGALLDVSGLDRHEPVIGKPQIRTGKSGTFCDAALEGFSHYAVIPNVNAPEPFAKVVSRMSEDQSRLFMLVARTWLAALAPDHEFRQTDVGMTFPWNGADWRFANSGRVSLVPGWKAILGGSSSEHPDFPPLTDGETGQVASADAVSRTTKPPARYTEGSLIKVMKEVWRLVDDPGHRARLKEATGIGTAATRGDILSGLLKQGQLTRSGKTLRPSEAGMRLWETLLATCPAVVDPGRTAVWEFLFDAVEAGRITAEDAVLKINATTQREIERIRTSDARLPSAKGSKPTPKMAAAARSVAKRKGIKLPKGVVSDFDACRAFLDEQMGARDDTDNEEPGARAPSEAQKSLAASLAERMGSEVPSDALGSASALSAWIDGAMKKAPPRPPSGKQLAFARSLAERHGADIPENVERDMKACSAFIDKLNKGRKRGS
ncbi:MAG: DNA topoisomerase III [Boseongicola sp. SB0677_bin_26]|nr:DNA topoisomerase III [Boseongicola sp. SB0665_bin_10]MYG25661.1 DNA topoisomerase III [Boseongicola sp. SB0677_bin_26]